MSEGTTKGEETPQNIEVVESAKDEGRNRSQASMGVTFPTQKEPDVRAFQSARDRFRDGNILRQFN